MDKEDKIVLSRLLEALSIESANWGDESLPKDLFNGISEEYIKGFSSKVISYFAGEDELEAYSKETLENPNNPISMVLQMFCEKLKEEF